MRLEFPAFALSPPTPSRACASSSVIPLRIEPDLATGRGAGLGGLGLLAGQRRLDGRIEVVRFRLARRGLVVHRAGVDDLAVLIEHEKLGCEQRAVLASDLLS